MRPTSDFRLSEVIKKSGKRWRPQRHLGVYDLNFLRCSDGIDSNFVNYSGEPCPPLGLHLITKYLNLELLYKSHFEFDNGCIDV